jgi:electron transport complex protein RnfB
VLAAIVSLTALGGLLGLLLALAARRLRVQADPLVTEIEALLPGAQCGQCGYPGCSAGAEALASGEAPVTLCPPGGRALAEQLADKLGIQADLGKTADSTPQIAQVREEFCTGCTRCRKICPTDAILGAPRQLAGIIQDACMGCGRCVEVCPTEALTLRATPMTLDTWYWAKPQLAA